jgi:hypothetical protein
MYRYHPKRGATYKVQRTGNTITYLVNDVVFHTSATTSSVPLYMDTAFFSAGGRLDEVTMLNAPVTSVPRTATYKIDYRNNNLINKPTIPTPLPVLAMYRHLKVRE